MYKRMKSVVKRIARLFKPLPWGGVGVGLLSILSSYAQDRWADIADTLLLFSPPSVYMFNDSVRQWMLDYEEKEGYAECYRRFYDAICQNIDRAREKGDDEALSEMKMCKLFMTWQQDSADTDAVMQQIRQIVDTDRQQHGDTTLQHVRFSAVFANMLCAARRYDEAEQWCQHFDSLMQQDVTVYYWHNSARLQAQMAAQAGRGRLLDAWQTALTIAKRYEQEVTYEHDLDLSDDAYDLRKLQLSDAMLARARRLAPQLPVHLLPPPPAAFEQADIAPWPLSLTADIRSVRRLHVLTVVNLHDMLVRLGLPLDYIHNIGHGADEISMRIHNYMNWDSIAPPLSAELCRRTAMMADAEAALCDTIHYPHNQEVNSVMTHWHRCMALQQLNFGSRSSAAVLRFCTEWIRKGYPLSMLPLVEEAAATMRQELGDGKPTQSMLLRQKDARRWLHDVFPLFKTLVAAIPEYAGIMATLETLKRQHE